jgi:hypothetical protein
MTKKGLFHEFFKLLDFFPTPHDQQSHPLYSLFIRAAFASRSPIRIAESGDNGFSDLGKIIQSPESYSFTPASRVGFPDTFLLLDQTAS